MLIFGQLCLLAAFVGFGFAAFACMAGWRSAQRVLVKAGLLCGVASTAMLVTVACVLAVALVNRDFRFAYVAQYTDRLLPWHYALSALWVGQAGSLLVWACFAGFLALVFRLGPRREVDPLADPAFGLLMAFCAFLVGTMVFAADPVAPTIGAAREGVGLSPLLQHPAMLWHPPIVFLGFAGWTVPFALAMVAVVTGKLDTGWVSRARPWALFSWAVLGGGILLGAHWAYEELGWGGYWAWDPVENGSLIPWLTGTALLHAMMAWQYRGVLKKTAVGLAIATFALCNFSTFLTRSGIFSSLHAFSQSPIGWLFLALLAIVAVLGGGFLLRRRHQLSPTRRLASVWSREAMISLAIVAILLMATVTCIGTLSAAISPAVFGRTVVVGPAFYNHVLMPTGILLLIATGAAPLLKWGASPSLRQKRLIGLSGAAGVGTAVVLVGSGGTHPLTLIVSALAAFAGAALAGAWWLDAQRDRIGSRWFRGVKALQKNGRKYSGFLVHLGFVSLAVGVTGSSLGARRQEFEMQKGQGVAWAGRSVRLVEITERTLPDKRVAEAVLEVSEGASRRYRLAPARHFHLRAEQWTTETAIHSDWSGDFYTILEGGEAGTRVRLTFVEMPMMRWLWLGGNLMLIGSMMGVGASFSSRARQLGGAELFVTADARRRSAMTADMQTASPTARIRSENDRRDHINDAA